MSLHFIDTVSPVLVALGLASLSSCSASDPPGSGSAGAKATTTATTSTTSSSTGTGGPIITGAGGGVGIDPGKGAAGAAGGSTTVSADAACVAEPRQGEQKPIALHFMMDNSGSMDTEDPGQNASRWVLINDAVSQFVNGPGNAGIWAGLDFFPELVGGSDGGRGGGGNNNNNPSCNVADYQNANVPIGLIPGINNAQAMAFTTAMGTRNLGGGTPTTPALQGAIAHAAAFQTMHPELAVAVVFTTDGQPNGCNSSVQNASAAAAAGVMGTPSIKTYVLGVGPEAADLDAIARAGGTNAAFLVTMGGSAALATALNTIRASTLTCDYKIPRRDGGTLDFGAVNVRVRVGSAGTWADLFKVNDGASCGAAGGWYYDNPVPPGNPAPTTITLCPTNCGPLTQTTGSQMDVLIGCATRPRIVQ